MAPNTPGRTRPVATVDSVFAFLLAVALVATLTARALPAHAALPGLAPSRVSAPGLAPGTVAATGLGPAGPAVLVGPVRPTALLRPTGPTVLLRPSGPAAPAVPAPPTAVASAPATTAPNGPPVPAAGPPAPPAAPAPVVVGLPAGTGAVVAQGPTVAALQAQTAAATATATKWLPSGKGMWIYEPAKTEGANAAAIVARARATGLTNLWVRMGSAWDGFNAAPFLDRLLPAAHAAGIRVVGWDFPKLDPVDADVARATAMIRYRSPSGDRVDAFSPDIESPAEGTHLTPDAARRYGQALRNAAGADYPLIVTVPRPAKERPEYPYADIVAGYDAIAPMIYWLDRQPDTDVVGALASLARFGKPLYPVGQAYDGSPEGGRKGVPPPEELFRFMRAAETHGAAGVSFWSWQAANQPAWNAIHDAVEFGPPPGTATSPGAVSLGSTSRVSEFSP